MAFIDLHIGILEEFAERQSRVEFSPLHFEEKFSGFGISLRDSDLERESKRQYDAWRCKTARRKQSARQWKKDNRERHSAGELARYRERAKDPAFRAMRAERERLRRAKQKASVSQ